MKTGATLINASLANETHTFARLWKIEPANGDEPITFTDHDENITFALEEYSCDIGFTATTIVSTSNGNSQGLDMSFALDDELVTAAKIQAGYFDEATCILRLVDYANIANGSIILFQGTVGKIRYNNLDSVTFEVRGIFDKIRRIIVENYGPLCRADLGDSRCKFDIDALKVDFTVASVSNNQNFTAAEFTQADNFWSFGSILWITGNNAGIGIEAAASDQSENSVSLFLPTPYNIQVGDTGRIWPGCDKLIKTCFERYNNVVNFRGEPFQIDEQIIAMGIIPTPVTNIVGGLKNSAAANKIQAFRVVQNA